MLKRPSSHHYSRHQIYMLHNLLRRLRRGDVSDIQDQLLRALKPIKLPTPPKSFQHIGIYQHAHACLHQPQPLGPSHPPFILRLSTREHHRNECTASSPCRCCVLCRYRNAFLGRGLEVGEYIAAGWRVRDELVFLLRGGERRFFK